MSLFSNQEEGEVEEFPATQFYGAIDAMDNLLDSTEAMDSADSGGAHLEPFIAATQAYNFPGENDNILATQVYFDDIDAQADTLQYPDVDVFQDPVVSDPPVPGVSAGDELMATQAYLEEDIAMQTLEDGRQPQASEAHAPPVERPQERPECAAMPPPKLPDRIKRKRESMEQLESLEQQTMAVATPVRSPRRPVLHEVLDVEDSPPKPQRSLAKRWRLYGKQPPPDRFLVASSAPNLPEAKGMKDKGGKGQDMTKASARKGRKRPKVYFALTGFVLDRTKRDKLEKIPGVALVDEWSSKVTHVVANGFRRTTKLMCAVCAGLHIVMPEFLDECIKAGEVISEEAYLLRDGAAEATFAAKHQLSSFSLQAAVQHARSHPALLHKKSVYWTDGSAAEIHELQLLVEAAGGRWLKRKPKALGVGATPKSLWLGQDFDPELLREAACTQVLRWDTYRLSRKA